MSKKLEENIISILKTIPHPNGNQDIVTDNIASPVTIKGSTILLVLTVPEGTASSYVSVQQECEEKIGSLAGVDKVNVMITSHHTKEKGRPLPPSPSTPIAIKGVKNVIIVASGKGGVGKSTVSVNLASALAAQGCAIGLVDADIYGPSLPVMLGIDQQPELSKGSNKMLPIKKHGIYSNSIGYMVEGSGALVWRGAMITKAIRQLLLQTEWNYEQELDYLIIDTPPGTGDIHITLAKNFKLDGVVIVTTPQQVALADADKAIDMYQKLKLPIYGLIENMSYAEIEGGERHYIFGKNGGKKLASLHKIPLLGEVPLVSSVSKAGDEGKPAYGTEKEISSIFNKVAESLRQGV